MSLSALVTDAGWERGLRGDVIGALVQAANWRFLVDDRSHAEPFAAPSPERDAAETVAHWLGPAILAAVPHAPRMT